MKTKSFDCVDMKHKGAEIVYQKLAGLSRAQQLDYWRRGSLALREEMQRIEAKDKKPAA